MKNIYRIFRFTCLLLVLLLIELSVKAQVYVTIGTGTAVNAPYTYPSPYGNFFYGARHQLIISAAELTAQGVGPNSVISEIAFQVQTPSGVQNGLTIRMGSSASATYSSANMATTLTTVFGPENYANVSGWNTHTFTTPYTWDGTSNLVVDVCFNDSDWVLSGNAQMYYTATTGATVVYRFADAFSNCGDAFYATSPNRPNIKLTIGTVVKPPKIPPLVNFHQDTLWKESPGNIVNNSTYSDMNYWDIRGYNDDSTDGVWDPYNVFRRCNAYGCAVDSQVNFRYTFPERGYYLVRLTGVNSYGVSYIEKAVWVDTPSSPPIANFFASRTTLGVNDAIAFYDISGNGPTKWDWWLDPVCRQCPPFPNAFNPTDGPLSSLQASDPGYYSVCLRVENAVGVDTLCLPNYINIIPGYQVCNGSDSVAHDTVGYVFPPLLQATDGMYYIAQSCNPDFAKGFRLDICSDSIYLYLERLRLRPQDSVFVRTGGWNGPKIRRWGGNDINSLKDTAKVYKFAGQELFITYEPQNQVAPVADSGFAIRWHATAATYPPPVADFTAPDTSYSGYKITLFGHSQGVKPDYAWDLDNDTHYGSDDPLHPDSTSQNPTVTFTNFQPGFPLTKTVCLRSSNCRGSTTKCKNIVILPITQPPVADFVANRTIGFTTDTFRFFDQTLNGGTNWQWIFNPGSVTYIMGTNATSINPVVILNAPQSYDVTLKVTNPFGGDQITKTTYVTAIDYGSPNSFYNPNSIQTDIGISRVNCIGGAGVIDTTTALKSPVYTPMYNLQRTVVYRGGTYSVDVYRNTAQDPQNMRIWIDFNYNANYGSDELILKEDSQYKVKTSATFTVPANTPIGNTRMLVGASADFSTLTPLSATLGVYEDFGIIVGTDTKKPVIMLNGDNFMRVELNKHFNDPWVYATDNIEGIITNKAQVVGHVDSSRVGYYTLKYFVLDNYNNVSDTVERLVQVDVNASNPTLTLNGADTVNVQVYNKYEEPGYTAVDNQGNNLNSQVRVKSDVDTSVLGYYMIVYKVSDAFDHSASAQRIVHVIDTIKPVLMSRSGEDTVVHQIGTAFDDNVYIKVTDNYWTNVQPQRTSNSVINPDERAYYTLRYTAVDGSGNIADDYFLTVNVTNVIKPVITLNGDAEIVSEVFASLSDPGAFAVDYQGKPVNNVTSDWSSVVNINKKNSYTVTYTATDVFGNQATVTRIVTIRDTKAPVITLFGRDPYYHLVNTPYVDLGAKAVDEYDGMVQVTIDDSRVNPNVLGEYMVYYNAEDQSGNKAEEKYRMVIVATSVGIKELLQHDAYALYPNPASTLLNIELRTGAMKGLKVYDLHGRLLSEYTLDAHQTSYKMDVSSLINGLYMLKLEMEDGKSYTSKFMITR